MATGCNTVHTAPVNCQAATLAIFCGCLLNGQAAASPIGFATAILYEHPVGGGQIDGTSAAILPPQSFTFPGVGSGSLGGNAIASYLSLGSSAFSTATSSNPCCSNGATVTAYAVTQDVLSASASGMTGLSGFLSFGFRISGTNLATAIKPGPLATAARSVVNVMSGPDLVNANPVNITGPDMGAVYGHVTFGAAEYQGSAFTVNVPIHYGTPVVTWIQLLSVAEGSAADGGIYEAVSDFDTTLTLDSVRLLDAAMQPVSNPVLVSQSGTIYPLAGDSGAGVPEPASFLLIAGGLLALGKARKF